MREATIGESGLLQEKGSYKRRAATREGEQL